MEEEKGNQPLGLWNMGGGKQERKNKHNTIKTAKQKPKKTETA